MTGVDLSQCAALSTAAIRSSQRRSGPPLADANRIGDVRAQDNHYRLRRRYSGTAHGHSDIRSSGATTYKLRVIDSQPIRLDLQRRALSLDRDNQRELELRPAAPTRWNGEFQSVYRVRRSDVPLELRNDDCSGYAIRPVLARHRLH